MKYLSTRNENNIVSASEAILNGIASDGGLFVPEYIPTFNESWDELSLLSYKQLAKLVLSYYLDFTEMELSIAVDNAYSKFDVDDVVAYKMVGRTKIMELFHGPTKAFKDVALSILPYLMEIAKKRLNKKNKTMILTATSGDTGSAALVGFKNTMDTKIVVFYPKHGVSKIQELQMVSIDGNNTHVIGIDGNFDDAQNAVKRAFNDKSIINYLQQNNYTFSSANSINIGRLLPQIVYYVHVFLDSYKQGAKYIDIVVPTGNFGNILACFYAKQMGVPIRNIVSASNENKVVYDFLKTGKYDANRPLQLTTSPSMDILLSSNLERLLHFFSSSEEVNKWMQNLSQSNFYEVDMQFKISSYFNAGFASMDDVKKTIKAVFKEEGYLLDPHTAVAYFVAQSLNLNNVIIAATASPYKFAHSVYESLVGSTVSKNCNSMEKLSYTTNISVPVWVQKLFSAKIKHDKVINPKNIADVIKEII